MTVKARRLAQAAKAERDRAHRDYQAALQRYQASLAMAERLESLAMAEQSESLL